MNVIIPRYTFAVRHPVYSAMQIKTAETFVDVQSRKGLETVLGCELTDNWIRAHYKFERGQFSGQTVEYFINLPAEMKAEYDELVGRGCHNLVLVEHINGHSFAIGNV